MDHATIHALYCSRSWADFIFWRQLLAIPMAFAAGFVIRHLIRSK